MVLDLGISTDLIICIGSRYAAAAAAAGSRNYPGCKTGLCVWVDGKLAAISPTRPTLTELELPA